MLSVKYLSLFLIHSRKDYCFHLDTENQLEHINKSIYESEKEVKRLESEQSQQPKTPTDKQQTQQPQPVPTPAFLNGFTLERVDNNEARRFVCDDHHQ